MTNQEIIEKCACGLSEDIDGEFYQLFDAKKICELKDEQFRQMVKEYIELAYDEGSDAHLLENLLKEF